MATASKSAAKICLRHVIELLCPHQVSVFIFELEIASIYVTESHQHRELLQCDCTQNCSKCL